MSLYRIFCAEIYFWSVPPRYASRSNSFITNDLMGKVRAQLRTEVIEKQLRLQVSGHLHPIIEFLASGFCSIGLLLSRSDGAAVIVADLPKARVVLATPGSGCVRSVPGWLPLLSCFQSTIVSLQISEYLSFGKIFNLFKIFKIFNRPWMPFEFPRDGL